MGPQDVTLFSAVDRTGDPGFFARFLDEGNRLPAIVAGKAVILDGLRLKPGQAVLDAGCGTGEDVVDLAAHVGPDGRVTGVDLSEAMIAEARQRTAGSGLPVSFEVADVAALPFPDGVFDLVVAVEVLEHVAVPGPALAEIARVARGPVVLTVPHEPWWRIANVARGKYVRALGNTPGHLNHWSRRGFARVVDGPLVVERVAGSFPWTLVAARVR
jgi:SAM-dependent methyltransferase